ncbi:hypothetical protein DPEC_G00068320 [Dallia pectoralis]|uniref:Uncharacterized protein n=1 Tax=Dallia pectoralis TaxID=75939 RepID=A0ACC2H2B9_DALPE|nr:hypothetical protein DPEC_G00068320 [Dallia pectoralis]
MLTDEQVCIPLAHSDPNVFKFPKLDFGMPAMGRAELEACSGCTIVSPRYIRGTPTTCTDLGEDLCQLLRNIGNVRAACLSLSIQDV